MKLQRRIVKAARACDDWDDDYPPCDETGTSYDLGGPVTPPRLRSVSPAAHAAIHFRPPNKIGFGR